MWLRRLTLLAIQLVIFLVLAEVAAVAVSYFETGALFYTHRPEYPVFGEAERGELSADALHPYFGPIHRVGVRGRTNAIGFDSPYDYPFERANPRQYIIGIFGGSVGWYFCDRGVAQMVAGLRAAPELAGRDIVPLCFAHEGYKQPQQLLVLAYFLSLGQQFDLVVNLDGFNEAALGAANNDRGRDISMPSPMHLDPLINVIDRSTLTAKAIESLAAISHDKERLNALAKRVRNTHSAFLGFAFGKYYEYTRHQYEAEIARFAQVSAAPATNASMIQLTPPVHRRDGDRLYADIAAEWESASLLMHDMLHARNVPYVHVLQPNQYASHHAFGADEARIALNPASPFKLPVERGYPALRDAGSRLAKRVAFFDASSLFDSVREPVYEDDCCHYNQRGNALLGAFVAIKVREVLRGTASPTAR